MRTERTGRWWAIPTRLVYFPGVLAAVVGASIILAVTAGAAPLLLSSAGTAALRDQVAATSGGFGGVRMVTSTQIAPDQVAFRQQVARDVTAGLPLGRPELTVGGTGNAELVTPRGAATVQLVARDRYLSHIEILEGLRGNPGFWVPATAATAIHVAPGDRITVRVNGQEAGVQVAGIYRDIAPSDVPAYWAPVAGRIVPRSPRAPTPPPFLLADMDEFLRLEGGFADVGTIEIDMPVHPGVSLADAKRLSDAIGDIQAALFDFSTPLSAAFQDVESGLPRLVKDAEDTVTATSQPLRAVSLAGMLVALVVTGAAGAYGVRRRRTEIGLLSARGVGPSGIALRTGLEAVLPVALGAAAGWAGAILLVRGLGPSSDVERDAMLSALLQVGLVAAAAVVLLGVAGGLATRAEVPERPRRFREVVGKWPWEVAALAAAGASLYEILTRTTTSEGAGAAAAPKLDLLILLFPFLFVAGTSGLVVRWGRGLLPRLKRAASGRRSWLFLAASRLASAPRAVTTLAAASALAVGVLTYAGVLASSISATTEQKATLSIGADVAMITVSEPTVTGKPGFAWTPVTRIADLKLPPSDTPVDVLAIDPASFARTAYWNSRLGPPLASMTRRLPAPDTAQAVPAIVAGGELAPGATVAIVGKDVPIQQIATVGDFPGARKGRPTVIVDLDAFQHIGRIDIAGVAHFYELWARGDPHRILPYLSRIGFPLETAITAQRVRSSPAFLALSWTFGLLQAFGILAGLIAALGVILYLQARQRSREASYALARRMGLSSGSHLRSVAAELSVMLLVAFLLGAVFATVAAALVHGQLDPIPDLPPSPFLVTPPLLYASTGVGVLLVALFGAWWVQRRADRANPAEVMRIAG